ncbi:hypothetical protein [Rhodococcus qingshengii]|uniref:hypothetical protein n=1 Tax=Rhodococcus qingshengii TaxID=334542 RepID=UPI001C21D54C|nr:hypothetical protein [Rhodococcus qingshengii]QXC46188.1 hypothetical protein KSE96_30985 [Rhodococcus qingshengii]
MTTHEPQPCRPMWEPQWPQNVSWFLARYALFMTAVIAAMFAVADGAQVQGPAWAHNRTRNYRLEFPTLALGTNVFRAVLRQLYENLKSRQHQAGPAFREMFTVPPLHERWRLSGRVRKYPALHIINESTADPEVNE